MRYLKMIPPTPGPKIPENSPEPEFLPDFKSSIHLIQVGMEHINSLVTAH
jgi:hypothetical protein